IEQLTGDGEVTTSGRGFIGLHAAFDLKSSPRVEAYVKKKCADAGGFGSGLRKITVTEHGCTLVFDSKLALMPVFLDPIPISAQVAGDGGVVTAGFTTFAHDPPDARAAYDAALSARASGDLTAYHARLAEIERRYPKSLAAQRAAALRTPGPLLGAGVVATGS